MKTTWYILPDTYAARVTCHASRPEGEDGEQEGGLLLGTKRLRLRVDSSGSKKVSVNGD